MHARQRLMRFRPGRRAAAALPLALVAIGVAAPAAFANHYRAWGTLNVYTDGVLQGGGNGTYTISTLSDGTHARVAARMYDARPGGEGIYTEIIYQWNAGYCVSPEYMTCTANWFNGESDQTPRWYESHWSDYFQEKAPVSPSGDYGRGRIRVCEDQSWSTDDCSGWAYTYGHPY